MNLFTFLYTHKYQMYSSSTFTNWITPKVSSLSYQTIPTVRTESNFHTVYTKPNSICKLSIEVNGQSYYDCSTPISADRSVNCSLTALESEYLLESNLYNTSNSVNQRYEIADIDVSLNYPIYNPSLNSYLSNVALKENDLYTNIASFGMVPYGVQRYKRFDNNLLSSYFISRPPLDYILPNSILNKDINKLNDINTCSLYQWSLGLLNLIHYKEDLMIVQSLNYICNFYLLTKSSKSKGIPTLLTEDMSSADNYNRDVISNCWAGFSIIQAIGYLSNRPSSNIVKIEVNIQEVLASIVDLVESLTNEISGQIVIGIDEYNGVIDRVNLDCSYIASVFLNQYLCYFYNENTHTILERIQTCCIDNIYTDTEDFQLSLYSELSLISYKLYWILFYSRNVDILSKLLDRITSLKFNNPEIIDTKEWLLICYSFDKLIADGLINTNYSTLYSSININNDFVDKFGLFVKSNKLSTDFINILDVSWSNLIKSNSILLTPQIFELKTDSIGFYIDYLYKVITYTWPTSDRWFLQSVVYNKQSVLGSILNSTAEASFDFLVKYLHLQDSFSCSTSQGKALDFWGVICNILRPRNQADYYFKDTLKIFLNRSVFNISTVKSFVLDLLGDNYINISQPKFPLVYYRQNGSLVWLSRQWTGSKEDVDLVKSQVNLDGYPCFYVPDPTNLGNFILSPFYNYTGFINIESESVDSVSASVIKNASIAGVTFKIYKVILMSDSNNKNTTNTFNLIT